MSLIFWCFKGKKQVFGGFFREIKVDGVGLERGRVVAPVCSLI
jgi:hypothetical protein